MQAYPESFTASSNRSLSGSRSAAMSSMLAISSSASVPDS
jgi:hypothetical protein